LQQTNYRQWLHTIPSPTLANNRICVTAVGPCGSSQTCIQISKGITTAPVINGPILVCRNQTYTYTVVPIPGATSYVWEFPTRATGTIAANGLSASVAYNGSANGPFPSSTPSHNDICVYAVGPCGQSPQTCIMISLDPNCPPPCVNPPTPLTITGPQILCPGSVAQYCITMPANSNATAFHWWIDRNATPSLSFSPPGQPVVVDVVIPAVSGQTTICINVYVPTGYTGGSQGQEVEVEALSGPCVSNNHVEIDDIFGGVVDDGNPCTFDYCSSGQILHTNVTDGAPGVDDGNPCTSDICLSGQTIHNPIGGTTIPPTAGPLTGPGTFSGSLPWNANLTMCSAGTYQICVPPIPGAVSYKWTFDHASIPALTYPGGLSTITTTYNCIDVIIPPGYNPNSNNPMEVEVRGVNCIGTGHHSEIGILMVNSLAQPGNINGLISVCKSQTKLYSIPQVPGATSYTWSITGGASIISGQGTTSVSVDFSTTTTTPAVLSVYATSPNCTNSQVRTLTITVILNCKVSSQQLLPSEEINLSSIDEIKVYPNPTSGNVTLSINSSLESKVNMKVVDIIGKTIIDQDLIISEGLNTKEIKLENVIPGMYFITLGSNVSGTTTLRLIVE
jgi:hypothetical protein